jgi:hypothetical protein
MMCRETLVVFLLLLCANSSWARGPQAVEKKSAESLIDESNANAEQNAKAALAYTFSENYVASQTQDIGRRNWRASHAGGAGESIKGGDSEFSMQYDVLFIKNVPYRRLVSVNHRPLSHTAAAEVSERYDAMVATIHVMSDEQRLKMAEGGGHAVMVDPKQLTSLYACSIVGHGKVQMRAATMVECKPRTDLTVKNGGAAEPVSTDVKLWIDEEQPFFARTSAVLDRKIHEDQRLTKIIVQWRLFDGVWHQALTEVDWVGPEGSGIHGKVVDTFFHFKRFRVDAKIVP